MNSETSFNSSVSLFQEDTKAKRTQADKLLRFKLWMTLGMVAFASLRVIDPFALWIDDWIFVAHATTRMYSYLPSAIWCRVNYVQDLIICNSQSRCSLF